MLTEIHDKWIYNCKVTMFPWIDGETIYFHLDIYEHGGSCGYPKEEKTVFFRKTERNEEILSRFTETVANGIRRMSIDKNRKYILDFQ